MRAVQSDAVGKVETGPVRPPKKLETKFGCPHTWAALFHRLISGPERPAPCCSSGRQHRDCWSPGSTAIPYGLQSVLAPSPPTLQAGVSQVRLPKYDIDDSVAGAIRNRRHLACSSRLAKGSRNSNTRLPASSDTNRLLFAVDGQCGRLIEIL